MSEATQTAGTDLEVELTYLARAIPAAASDAAGKLLIDIYVPDTAGIHPRLRIRQKGDSYELTKKVPVTEGDASVHEEVTTPLSQEEFDALASSSSKKVSKMRYNVVIDGHDAEVDVFQDGLAGLVVIDFEFPNEETKARFTPPDVCLADVTQEDFIAGGLLAGKSYADIEPELNRFGYVKLNG